MSIVYFVVRYLYIKYVRFQLRYVPFCVQPFSGFQLWKVMQSLSLTTFLHAAW